MSAIWNHNRTQWIAAAERLLRFSNQNVPCPQCGQHGLQVRDVEYGWGPRRGLYRYLTCSECGAHNAVNLRHAGPAPGIINRAGATETGYLR